MVVQGVLDHLEDVRQLVSYQTHVKVYVIIGLLVILHEIDQHFLEVEVRYVQTLQREEEEIQIEGLQDLMGNVLEGML